MSPHNPEKAREQQVFVTVGTTTFDGLIGAVLKPSIISLLHTQGYTSICIQHGKSAEIYQACRTPELEAELLKCEMSITAFAYADSEEITNKIKLAELVICHAGSGTILDCLRYQKRIIAVPNTTLMENHQAELADEMSKQQYVVKGSLKSIARAIERSATYPYRHFPRMGSKVFTEILEDELDKVDKDKMYG
ncbi:UDP-N-acetylglucosamine transferase subunit [Drechslerella dactyloides]|uniref:UDP-N-acetylglucosamine transferase subunit ALG13 n=1 Tax=Drechslerella dactyloides TaxID=74499 RepID=A0AAD6NHW3_DREDA|nr:UDP-N-acetylglucosamine transferase subunit [Drechslerella dactyloides]